MENNKIDYTLLDQNASKEDIENLCIKAESYGVKTVCIYPEHIKTAKNKLKEIGSNVKICTVVSFPNGDDNTNSKITESIRVSLLGADEIDLVYNWKKLKLEALKNPINDPFKWERNEEINSLIWEIEEIKSLIPNNVILKVIVESGELTDKETQVATAHCIEAGADYIKTSTGKTKIGAEINKVKSMKYVIDRFNSKIEIKASGGIKNLEEIKKYIDLGVSRIGIGDTSFDKIQQDVWQKNM
jgi:deoxyribose-phosphate aldolase